MFELGHSCGTVSKSNGYGGACACAKKSEFGQKLTFEHLFITFSHSMFYALFPIFMALLEHFDVQWFLTREICAKEITF